MNYKEERDYCKENFQLAIEEERFWDAYLYWMKIQENHHLYLNQEDWCDHNSRKIFQFFCKDKNWMWAKQVCEKTLKPQSKEGRIKRLEELSGLKYQDIDLPKQ